MSKSLRSASRFPIFRRLWKPAVVTGTGGTAVAIWFEELLAMGTEILALIFIPIMAGAIYLLDIFMFKSRMPKHENFSNVTDKGAKK